jgi:pimeloyl-ACP methyl ester carboxylesterase
MRGFPSSSREFDTLIPLLATHYHLIAPDFPGFGQSDTPPPSTYSYTFDQLAKTTSDLLEQLKISKCSFYLHDYGGPVGFRMSLAHPERVQALIIQNANVYKEGLGAKWAGIAQYWADPRWRRGRSMRPRINYAALFHDRRFGGCGFCCGAFGAPPCGHKI